MTAGVSRNGAWNGDCASTHRSGSYARFYSFSLSEPAEVQIDLTSSEDTYLYLLRGADSGGTVLGENDDVVNGETDSRITETLAAGRYTVEATTYGEGVSGEFSLSVVPAATPPSTDGCFQTLGGVDGRGEPERGLERAIARPRTGAAATPGSTRSVSASRRRCR